MTRHFAIHARIGCMSVLLALTLARVPVASAQRVVGTVVDAGSGRAIEEFTVRLLDAQGRSVAATLSQPGGRFSLTAPMAGEYTLVVLRIGFQRSQSEALTLNAGEVVQQRLRMVQVPTRLDGVRVDDRPQCEGSRPEGTGFVAVWGEIEKAVQVVELTQSGAPLLMTTRDYHRDISLRSGATIAEASELSSGRTRSPYVNPEPEEIARTGYVQRGPSGTTYLAPDARTLLSPSFVATHCFTIVSDAEHGSAMIGVAFVPVASRRVPDIRGTLWVDRRSGELRTLDFTYTDLPTAARSRPYGGHVRFQHIAGGAWIIGAWRVRAPYLDVVPMGARIGVTPGVSSVPRAISADTVVQRLREQGGEVLVVRDAEGSVLWASADSTLHGVVRDSTTRVKLPGVTELPASAGLARDSLNANAFAAQRCGELWTAREQSLGEQLARPSDRWAPAGADSAAQADAFRRASVVLQAIADTSGRVDLSTARTLKRGAQAVYVEALNALSQLRPTVDQPLPGCKLRTMVLLPYRVRAER